MKSILLFKFWTFSTVSLSFSVGTLTYPLAVKAEGGHSQATRFRETKPAPDLSAVQWVPIKPDMIGSDPCYKDSIAPGVLRLACLPSEEQLEAFFAQRGVLLEKKLERKVGGKPCHLYYEPTFPGFRASTEDATIKGLVFNLESAPFVAQINADVGDPLSISRGIVSHITRPLDIHLAVPLDHDPSLYRTASKALFGHTPHKIMVRDSRLRGEQSTLLLYGDTWPQDYLKSGHVGENQKFLLARKFCENGEGAQNAFEGPDGVRSHLGWQGGDFTFIKNPKTGKTVLVYGNAAREMWGKNLSQEEVGYILQQEFGADERVYVGGITPHIDYFLSFIPHQRLILASEPVPGNRGFFCDALQKAMEYINHHAPEPVELGKLREMACIQQISLHSGELKAQAKRAIEEFRRNSDQWQTLYIQDFQIRFTGRLINYIKSHYEKLDESTSGKLGTAQGFDELLHKDPELARDFLLYGSVMGSKHNRIFHNYLEILERELEPERPGDKTAREEKIHQITQMGFDVIRVPGIPGANWAGVSYANNLLVDNILFVPTYGLAAYEKGILDNLSRQLSPKGIKVVPINATYSMDENGAIHCRVAVLRK